MRMQRRLVALLGPAALGLGLSACAVRTTTMPEPSYPPPGGYARAPGAYDENRETVAVGAAPTEHYTESYPPEPLYETVAPSPGDDHVWIDGSWHWNGYEWVWLGGNWVPEPVDLVYIEPHYGYQDDYHVYRPGHWTRREHIPRGVIVRDHRQHRPVTGHYPRPERPHHRVPIEGGRHGHRPPHASPQPGDRHGTPTVRDHRMPRAGDPGNGAPPPRTEPPPRHQGPDQAGPPTVPRPPPPDISSPPSRAIPADRPSARDHRNFGGSPPRSAPAPRDHRNFGGPPPRSAPAPRDHRNFGGPPPRSAPAQRGVPSQGAPPPRSAPATRDHRNFSGAAGPARPQRPAGPPPRRR